ncbi:MAG: hypothetical protein KKA10_14110 [Euryarchaeota archaeon]|nr:hypothetical protein [Euryarchaeota archaeon]MCG2736996.1 hypothetical protein [Candidatus Methanoperedenaceae archaeon]
MTKQFTERTLSNISPSPCFNLKFAEHPEDQILHIIQQKEQVFWNDLPKNLKRTCRWTMNLEKQGLIKRVKVKGRNGVNRLLLITAMPDDLPGGIECTR